MQKKWHRCPQCRSNRVIFRGSGDIFFRGLMYSVIMGVFGFLTIPFFIGIPILVAGALTLLVMIGISMTGKTQGQCKDCGHMWYVG